LRISTSNSLSWKILIRAGSIDQEVLAVGGDLHQADLLAVGEERVRLGVDGHLVHALQA
jgi:hypothetical protein